MEVLSLLLEEEIQSDFITKVFPILRYVLFGIIIAAAIVIIVTILLQSNNGDDAGNIMSGTTQESYYSQNKGSTREGKLKIITIIMASIIAFCSLLFFITEIINKTAA